MTTNTHFDPPPVYQVYFLINESVHLLDLAGPSQAFHEANELSDQFNLQYIGFSETVSSFQGLGLTQITKPPEKLPERSILIICASKYRPDIFSDRHAIESINWLRTCTNSDTIVLGICTGTFLLGKAGLLNNRVCTTHHSLTNELSGACPAANVIADRIFTQDNNLYTTAGVTAGIDLCLQIIEDITSAHCAVAVARDLVVHRRRMANDPQLSNHLSFRNHVSPLIHSVQDYISSQFRSRLSTQEISDKFRVSQRHLQRLFKEYTGTTLREYLLLIRLEEAKSLLKNSKTIEQAADLSGFPQSSSFRAAWKKYFGTLPSDSMCDKASPDKTA